MHDHVIFVFFPICHGEARSVHMLIGAAGTSMKTCVCGAVRRVWKQYCMLGPRSVVCVLGVYIETSAVCAWHTPRGVRRMTSTRAPPPAKRKLPVGVARGIGKL